MDIVSNLTSTLTGNIEKAVIRIADDRAPTQLVKRAAVQANGTAASKNYTNDKMNNLATNKANKARLKAIHTQMANLKQDSASYKALAEEEKSLKQALAADSGNPVYDKSFEVQFNPSTLTLSSYAADDDVEIQDFRTGGGQISRGAVDLHVELGVQLIFDRMVNASAFSEDVLNYSYSGLAKNIGGAISRATEEKTVGQPNSVQVMVEGLTAALRDENTRRVCFEWGKMSYSGILKNVNANYTMFDREGRPVRAVVTLKLYLRDSSVTPTDQGYWEEAYEAAFGDNNGLITTKRAGQAAGSLIGGLF